MDFSSNLSIGRQENFSSITTFNTTNGIPVGQAFQVNSLTPSYSTRLYSVNDTYGTDLYYPKFNGIDTLISSASIVALTNKDLLSATNTFPTSLATLTGVQTLMNKTLTSPSANTISITSAGFAGSPAIIFSETGNDTGFYHPADGALGIMCNGNKCTRYLNSDITFYGPSGFHF